MKLFSSLILQLLQHKAQSLTLGSYTFKERFKSLCTSLQYVSVWVLRLGRSDITQRWRKVKVIFQLAL